MASCKEKLRSESGTSFFTHIEKNGSVNCDIERIRSSEHYLEIWNPRGYSIEIEIEAKARRNELAYIDNGQLSNSWNEIITVPARRSRKRGDAHRSASIIAISTSPSQETIENKFHQQSIWKETDWIDEGTLDLGVNIS